MILARIINTEVLISILRTQVFYTAGVLYRGDLYSV